MYLLDSEGLAQLTVDDVEDTDELSNLTSSAAMTNVLSSDGKWKMTWWRFRVDHPCLIFAATDGCFGFVSTPMEFEHMVLQALLEARDPTDFERALDERFGQRAGDDYTLAMLSVGFGSFAETQKALAGRFRKLEGQYIRPLEQEDAGAQTRQTLWARYREDYHRCVPEEWRSSHGND